MNFTRIARAVNTGLRGSCINGTITLDSLPITNHLLSSSKMVRLCHSNPNKRKPLYKTKEAKKIRFYVVEKYVEYLRKLEAILEKRFPHAMKIYKLFMEGVGEFVKDTKDFFRIIRFLNTPGKSFSDLLRKEMELYDQMPRDMKKVAPILIIASIPFGTSILPLAYMFPRQLLCSHFWTLQQKSEFQIINLKHRLTQNKPVFRHLQSQLNFLKPHCLYEPWKDILGLLGSGVHPSVDQIVACKELFMTEPYHLLYLSRNHVVHLCRMHEMTVGFFFRRSRLAERAYILKEMDKAIMKEGGVENLPVDALKKSCYIRGLNPANVKNEEMIKYLADWIQLSSHINKDCYSLLLHAPILLGYNSPSNWSLIYEGKK